MVKPVRYFSARRDCDFGYFSVSFSISYRMKNTVHRIRLALLKKKNLCISCGNVWFILKKRIPDDRNP
jgi:hypothetical protein